MNPSTQRSTSLFGSFGDLDRELLEVLETYLELRARGAVDQMQFLRNHESMAEELEPLLASVNALLDLGLQSPAMLRTGSSSSDGLDLVSKTLGDYEILREVGRGGMGIVYEARQVSLDRVVALKVLPQSIEFDETRIARFLVEAQAAAQLHHPNIVPIYSVGCEGGMHCYSMLFIDGVSLDRYEEVHGGVGQTRYVKWISRAARALDHAHERGVIHRDVKPSNLMIDDAGKLWVTDFGLARCRGDSSLTKSGVVIGTLRYMSPEQASGRQQSVDHRSDIYSLGLTLYELVTGHAAFPNGLGRELTRPAQAEPIAPRRVNSAVAVDLETIILKSIDFEPAQRYATAAAFADDLERFIDGRPIVASRPSALDRLSKWASRHRLPVAVGLGVLLVGFLISLGTIALFASKQGELRSAIARERAQEAKAQANFRRTREILDHFGLVVAEQLADVQGATPIRKRMIRDLLEYYEEFVGAVSDSPELREELAKTHFRAGRIVETIGGTEQALKAYSRARTLYQQLAASRETTTDEIILHLALCHNNIGILCAELGDVDSAEQEYAFAIETLTSIDEPGSQVIRELAGVYGNLGLLHSANEAVSKATDALETSLSLLNRQTHRRDSELVLASAMTLNNLGYLYQDFDIDRALGYNNRAVRILRRQLQESDNQIAIHPLATSLNNQASLLARKNLTRESLDAYQEALALYQVLVAKPPYSLQFVEELAITYNNLGRLFTQLNRYREATSAFGRSKELLTELCRNSPRQQRYFASLGGVLNNQARVSMKTGQLELAIAQYKDSLEQQQKHRHLISDHQVYESMLQITYQNFETALLQSGRKAEAQRVRNIRNVLQKP